VYRTLEFYVINHHIDTEVLKCVFSQFIDSMFEKKSVHRVSL